MNEIKIFIKNKIKFINEHLYKCNENHCLTCSKFYIKLDTYEELINEIEKNGNTK